VAKFDLRARAWIFSKFHHQNGIKIGGGLEETPTKEILGDQTFLRAILSRK